MYKSSGKKSFIDALSIMDTEWTPPNVASNASTSTPAGKGSKSKAQKSKKEITPTKKIKV